ncbi:hypothetical protein IWW38_002165 [Coemansia aciculifera]|uniref:Uncharacterized protein n=1 Tax=Coemansia aciculifera TaxID=417176 RepID=A0ACC1M4Q3_9FUNG|nr:hypothetical protein IWW38_002165 [Coemansia aciculifera]
MLNAIAAAAGVILLSAAVTAAIRPTPSVRGRTVVIVGASSGIGRCLALEYAARGANLILCARRLEQLQKHTSEDPRLRVSGLEQLVHRESHPNESSQDNTLPQTEPADHPSEAQMLDNTVVGDITQRTTQLALLEAATKCDYLVLNAGAISVLPIADQWEESFEVAAADRVESQFQQILALNVVAPAVVAGLFLPLLEKSRGSVVVVSSMAGLAAAPTRSLYSASKHAVSAYFNAFRMEVAGRGVAVTVVYPGTVDTDLRRAAVDAPSPVSSSTTVASGSSSGKLSPDTCARQIVRAAALGHASLITPFWPYALVPILYPIVPGFIDYLAKKKYGFA